MKTVIQRVRQATVTVDGETVGAIDQGLLVFIGVEQQDTTENADQLIRKLLQLRIFADVDGKMNLNVQDITGGLLLVSQFTLAAEVKKGNRPGFSRAASPEKAKNLYDYIVQTVKKRHEPVASGIFAADMQILLINDGPVTFIIES